VKKKIDIKEIISTALSCVGAFILIFLGSAGILGFIIAAIPFTLGYVFARLWSDKKSANKYGLIIIIIFVGIFIIRFMRQ